MSIIRLSSPDVALHELHKTGHARFITDAQHIRLYPGKRHIRVSSLPSHRAKVTVVLVTVVSVPVVLVIVVDEMVVSVTVVLVVDVDVLHDDPRW
jgi:hypothetical protein